MKVTNKIDDGAMKQDMVKTHTKSKTVKRRANDKKLTTKFKPLKGPKSLKTAMNFRTALLRA